ncbi:hypothetical protein E2C01_075032 [Portunus trituberculatus]|uniref:Uncharacterized protein n=1 Tax=Portunus trituberculatus TaxID=210409 RepID=A0A5B7I9N3_PORTR|nr:hypothetical protein [Portunus trituberculatus]
MVRYIIDNCLRGLKSWRGRSPHGTQHATSSLNSCEWRSVLACSSSETLCFPPLSSVIDPYASFNTTLTYCGY